MTFLKKQKNRETENRAAVPGSGVKNGLTSKGCRRIGGGEMKKLV